MGIRTGYEDTFGTGFQQHILAVLLRSPGLVMRYRSALDHTYFSSESIPAIAKSLLASVDTHKVLPTRQTLLQLVSESLPEDAMGGGQNTSTSFLLRTFPMRPSFPKNWSSSERCRR